MPEVIIRRSKDGMEFGIQSGDFRRGKHFQQLDGSLVTYEEAGFRIVSLADGSPYEGPLNDPPVERHAPMFAGDSDPEPMPLPRPRDRE